MPIVTPINLILLAVFIVFLYVQLRPQTPVTLPKGPPPAVFRTFTPTTLLEFNGEGERPVYLAVRGRIFDVTPGKGFYGPVCCPNIITSQVINGNQLIIDSTCYRADRTRILPDAMLPVDWPFRASIGKCSLRTSRRLWMI